MNLSKETIEELKNNFKQVTENDARKISIQKDQAKRDTRGRKHSSKKSVETLVEENRTNGEGEQRVVDGSNSISKSDFRLETGERFLELLFGTTEEERTRDIEESERRFEESERRFEERARDIEESYDSLKNAVNDFTRSAMDTVASAYQLGRETANESQRSSNKTKQFEIEPTTIDVNVLPSATT